MSLEERVVRIETKIEANFESIGKSVTEIRDAIVVLTDLQKENITQGARLEALEKNNEAIWDRLYKTEKYQYELGCPQLKHTDAVLRSSIQDVDNLGQKVNETYPVCSRLVAILDSAVAKIAIPVILAVVAFWGYVTWSVK